MAVFLPKYHKENILYHGSYYLTKELKPGIHHTGEEIFWDQTESNKFLYATTNKELAIEMGFCSGLTQIGYEVKSFSTNNGTMKISVYDKELTLTDIYKVKQVYLYSLPMDNFISVNNQFNNVINEYKTNKIIKDIKNTETINIRKFLSTYKIILN